MAGMDGTTFEPNEAATRAMVVTMLYRLEGMPQVDGEGFSDVPTNAYYADATIWAQQAGIVAGFGDGHFVPNQDVTREQLVVMLMNYTCYKGYSAPERGDLSMFKDAALSGAYAKEALAWAYATGILQGKAVDVLAPTDGATRAEIAAIFERLIRSYPVSLAFE